MLFRSRFSVSGLQPNDTLTMDDRAFQRAALGAGYPVNPGHHALVVRRDGAEATRREFDIAEGASLDVAMDAAAA